MLSVSVTYGKRLLRAITASFLCVVLLLVGLPVHSEESKYSDSYASGIFYRRLCNVQLQGDQRQDIVNIAMSQIGYTEGNGKNALSGLSNGNKNYTEFGLWYNDLYGPDGYERAAWCAMFVSWCANQAGIPSDIVYYHAFTPYGLNWFQEQGRSYTRQQVANGSYTPLPGDIVYFKSNANNRIVNHVGIVVRYSDGILYAIEGNTYPNEQSSEGGQVCLKSYSIGDSFIRYICSPNYQ